MHRCVSFAVEESAETPDEAQLMLFVRCDEPEREFLHDILGVATHSG